MKAERSLTIHTILRSFIVALLLSGVNAYAQKTPERGFQPSRSYSIGDIETINTTNGNLLFNIPLASLPAGRGGMSANLNLIYNSKIWDPSPAIIPDPNNWSTNVSRTWLLPSKMGGWRYGFKYKVELVNRLDQYMYSAQKPQCPSSEAYQIYKLRVILPDGSAHEFTPQSYEAYPYSSLSQDGYYSVKPDGRMAYCNCSTPYGTYVCTTDDKQLTTNRMVYYSTDGTYMRLVVEHDSDANWSNNSWTLYMSDGSRVSSSGISGTGGSSSETQTQTIYDRNDNQIEIQRTTQNGHQTDKIVDQLGRSMIIEYGCAPNQDCIYTSGFNNEQLMWAVKWKQIAVHKTYNAGTNTSGWFDLDATLTVIDQIILPAQAGGLSYTFDYNPGAGDPTNGWGEVSSITLPTGAKATYTYKNDGDNSLNWSDVLKNYPERKELTYQQEYDGTSTQKTDIWEYEINASNSKMTSPDGGIVLQGFNQLDLPGPAAGLVYIMEQPDGTVIERNWQYNTPFGANAANPYVKTEFVSIRDAGGNLVKTAIKDYNYDKNGNVTRVAEYDWVSYSSAHPNGGAPAIPSGLLPVRVTTNSYYHQTPDASNNASAPNVYIYHANERLYSLPKESQISSGDGQVFSRTEFSYDDVNTRGNLTEQRVWDSTKGAYTNPLTTGNSISVTNQYDSFGNVTIATDARGTQTKYTYASINGHADLYPTQVEAAFGKPEKRTSQQVYDFYTGVVTKATDVDNGVSTSTDYDDFGRPVLVKAAENTSAETHTVKEYSDALRRVITRSDLNSIDDKKLVSIQYYDQLGRVRLTRQLEDACAGCDVDETKGIKVQSRYYVDKDNHLTYQLVSNPYRADYSSQTTSESTMGWTRSKSDKSGHVIEVQTFSGSSLPGPWGNNTSSTGTVLTAYDSVYNTVTDQAGKSRKSEVDALGRLIKVFEDPQGLNYETSYDYDALGNLRQVTQGAQASRIFVYSSLSRLSSASNPESGMLQYEYDANGNLTTKTDARGVITSHGYDGLNRVVSRTYSDGTPAVTYTYDTLANGKGRLSSVSSTVSATNYISYDVLGRVTASSQVTNGQTYNFSYSYDLPGNLRYQTYPSGKVIETEYDSAGRMAGMKKQNGGYYAGGASTDTANKPQYSAHGAITALKLGNGLWEHTAFNSRLQPTEIGLGTTSADSSKLQLSYSYGTTANNGNVQSQVIVAAGLNLTQTYTYDALNRLKTFSETGGLTQTYDYDRWGNRAVTAGYTDPLAKMPTLTSLNDFKANNRIKSYDDNNWYDAAGNLKQIPGHSYAFDAENRMTSHDDSQTVGTIDDRYSYDGDGRRVKKVAGTVTTVFVYNAMGQMVAEYTDDSNPSPTSGTSYFTADNLGTPRVITNQQQGVISRHDYLPFGEEIKAGTGGRTTGQGYVDDADGVKQKFTQKERDAETGLDYFLARYYSSAQGRFTSVDPTLESMKLANPQTFNRYTYALNNPLRYIDPDGQIPVETAIDIVSLAHSFYDLIRNPSFTTAAFFVWDIAATIIPYAPGSYVAKGIKLSREAVEWSAKIGKTGYRGLRAEGIVDFTGKATKLADEFEATVNNKLVEAGIGLLGQGDDSVRRVLGMRAGDRAADFLGVTRGGSFLVGEAKGTDMVSAVIQLDNTIKALEGKLGAVKATPYLFLRRETNIQGNFKIVGDRLFRYDPALDKWVKQQAQGRDIIVRRVNE